MAKRIKKKFQIVLERIPMLCPIAIIWDINQDSKTFGIILICFVIAIQVDNEDNNTL